jgi:hypothetical protein
VREVEARRVEALKDQLRVVVVALEGDVDNEQLLDASHDRLKRQRCPPQLVGE